MHKNYFI